MKLILTLNVIPYALACLRVHGSIEESSLGSGIDSGTEAIDNGLVVCSAQWGSRIDQDNHYSISCLPGYIWAFTKTGSKSWYSNGINSYSFLNYATHRSRCCAGVCDDTETGWKIQCVDHYWDIKQFC